MNAYIFIIINYIGYAVKIRQVFMREFKSFIREKLLNPHSVWSEQPRANFVTVIISVQRKKLS